MKFSKLKSDKCFKIISSCRVCWHLTSEMVTQCWFTCYISIYKIMSIMVVFFHCGFCCHGQMEPDVSSCCYNHQIHVDQYTQYWILNTSFSIKIPATSCSKQKTTTSILKPKIDLNLYVNCRVGLVNFLFYQHIFPDQVM